MQSIEEWLPVVGYEGLYEVSNAGRVKRIAAGKGTRVGKELHPHHHSSGRMHINLRKDGKTVTWKVHRLVAFAFLGQPGSGQEVCHNDGDSTNNAVTNLRWDTHYANHLDSVKHGTYAIQAPATHCKRGHEFTLENTYIQPGRKSQHCRACRADNDRQRRINRRLVG